jgi:2-(1,2-epoxy-1,2-dihydrophenyl)acetyl-CoA isomerase
MNEPVLTRQHGSILEIALNRPDAYNALNLEMMKRLAQVLAPAASDTAIRGVVITGHGKAFCAGGDLKWIGQH